MEGAIPQAAHDRAHPNRKPRRGLDYTDGPLGRVPLEMYARDLVRAHCSSWHPPDSPLLQAKLERALVVTAGRGVETGPGVVLVRGARPRDPALSADQVVVLSSFTRLSARVPLCVLSSFLRTLSSAWCTSGRSGIAQACRACGCKRGGPSTYTCLPQS